MTRTWILSLGVLALAGGSLLWAQAPPAAFAVAEYKDAIEGDREGAIAEYLKVAQTADPAVAAQALWRAAEIHDRLEQKTEAERLYRRIVVDYARQAPAVAAAAGGRLADSLRLQTGTSPRLLWAPDGDLHPVTISADGRWMALDRNFGDEILVRNMATGEMRIISRVADPPALSRDGRLVAYNFFGRDDMSVSDPDGRPLGGLRLSVNEPGGSTHVVVSNLPGMRYFTPVAFSPDNTALLVTMTQEDWTRQLAWLPLDTRQPRLLKSLDWRWSGSEWDRPQLSPDGRFIAYAALRDSPTSNTAAPGDSTARHIYVLAADGSSERAVVTGDSVNTSPVWTPDGTRLLFLSDRGGDGIDLWAIAVPTGAPAGEPVLVKRLEGTTSVIGLTEAGDLYYVHRAAPRDDLHVAEVDIEHGGTTGVRRLTDTVGGSTRAPSWSPDGAVMAFRRATAGGQYQTGLRALQTGRDVAYPPGMPAVAWPGPAAWFRQTRALLEWCGLATGCPSGSPGYYQVDFETRQVRQLIRSDAVAPLRLTPLSALARDDRTLYAVLRPEGADTVDRIGRLNLVDGRLVDSFPVPGIVTIRGIALSPDDSTLAVTGVPAEPLLQGNRANFELHLGVVAVDGSGYRTLHAPFLAQRAAMGQTLTWTRDGRHVLFGQSGQFATRDFGITHVMRVATPGGAPQPTGLEFRGVYMALDPAGARIVFERNHSFDPELWVIDRLAPPNVR